MRFWTLVPWIVVWFSLPLDAVAQSAPSKSDVADAYLRTLYAFDFDNLADQIAADAVFRDVTAAALAGNALEYTGREEILTSFAAGAADSRRAAFDVETQFATGDYVALNLWYSAELRGEAVGIPGTWVPVRVPAVTILRVADGLVVEHVDYVDYDEMLRQIAAFPRPH